MDTIQPLRTLPDGKKFKSYEKEAQSFLPQNSYAVLRMDGKNFSSYTKRFEKPYDFQFIGAMDATTRLLCETIPGVIVGYTQSDEISLIFSDRKNERTDHWLGGKTSKILSLAAAYTTAFFLEQTRSFVGEAATAGGIPPVFDARLHTLTDCDEIQEYVRWRRFDAQKNSVTMAANTLHSHRELMGKSSKERLALLEGTPYEQLPEEFYNGRVTYRKEYMVPGFQMLGPASKQDSEAVPVMVKRSRWETEAATRTFMEGELLTILDTAR